MFASEEVSNWRTAEADKMIRRIEIRSAPKNVLCALRSRINAVKTLAALKPRSTRMILSTLAARPRRKTSIPGILETRSSQPQVARYLQRFFARASITRKSIKNRTQTAVSAYSRIVLVLAEVFPKAEIASATTATTLNESIKMRYGTSARSELMLIKPS